MSMNKDNNLLNDWKSNKTKQRQLKDNINTDLFIKALKCVINGYVDKEVLDKFYK